MLYAAKCYWPGVTEADLKQVAERAARAGLSAGRNGVAYLGSLLSATGDLALCLFQGPSPAAVIQASEQQGIPANGSWARPGSAPAFRSRKRHRPGHRLPAPGHGPWLSRTVTEALE